MKRTLTILIVAILVQFAMNAQDLKVMSYNIRQSGAKDGTNSWMYRFAATGEMIKDQMPDVFGVQEATYDQMYFIEQNFKEYKYVGGGREDGKKKGEHMAIFYLKEEGELLDGGTFWLSETPDKPSKGWDAACFRSCTWTKLKMKSNGQIFAYLNTHLDHVGNVARKEGLALIMKRAQEIVTDDMPIILTADFNAVTSNPIFEPLNGVMKDAREVAPETDRRATLNCYQPENEDKEEWIIDHIFFRGAEAKSFKVLRDKNYGAPYISDHYPVVMEAEI